jgi:hypothetical protein
VGLYEVIGGPTIAAIGNPVAWALGARICELPMLSQSRIVDGH